MEKDRILLGKVNEICKDKTPFKHIEAMDYPRMAGTNGVKQAAEYIEGKFKEYGFEPKVDEFYLPKTSKRSGMLIPTFLITWGAFSFINAFYISGILGYIFASLVLLVPVLILIVIFKLEVLFKRLLNRNYQKIQNLTKQIEEGIHEKPMTKERNIYVEYNPEDYEEHLYLTAHYDSTTLKLNMRFIRLFMLLSVLGGFTYLFGYLAHYLLLTTSGYNLFGEHPLIFLILLMIFLVSMSLILFGRIFRTNKSHGAIDNLTGTAIILELARIVKEAKIVKPKLKITFIVFTAEEVGLFGSAFHYRTRENLFENQKLHVVSIDMIGEIPPLTFVKQIKPFLGIPMEPEFNNTMIQLSEKLGIKINLKGFLYPGSDFANWFLNGYPANWLMTPSKYIHSPQDIAQNVNQELLNDALKLFTAYLLEKTK